MLFWKMQNTLLVIVKIMFFESKEVPGNLLNSIISLFFHLVALL